MPKREEQPDISINAKTDAARLRRTLRRRLGKPDGTAVDHALPRLAPRGAKESAAPLRLRVSAQAELSPYVVRFRDLPDPAELAEEIAEHGANLLLGASPEPGSDGENGLTLTRNDVIGQLAEGAAIRAGRAALPARSRARVTSPAEAALAAERHAERPAMHELAPKQAPSDLMDTLELPEMDDEEPSAPPVEEEALTLPELVAEPDAQPEPAEPARRVSPGPRLARAGGMVALLALVLVLPLHAMQEAGSLMGAQDDILAAGNGAAGNLALGAQAALGKDLSSAQRSFEEAGKGFGEARDRVEEIGASASLLLNAIPATRRQLRTGTALIDAGESLAEALERLSEGARRASEPGRSPTSRLRLLSAYAEDALPRLQGAAVALERADPGELPPEMRAELESLKARVPLVLGSLEEFVQFSDLAVTLLGGEGSKRYLLAFQNNTEIRATGGFWGSYAILDMHDGRIESLEIPGGGTYDLQGQLMDFVAAPKPMQLLRARWEFQDVNWFPDFPTTARQAMEFYEASGRSSVDGVIAVNATYVSELIGLLGPVEMNEYGRVIDEDNFLLETQRIVENEYDREENRPKAFIGDLAPKLLDRVEELDADGFLTILSHLSKGLVTKDVQIYLSDDELERRVLDLGWGGAIEGDGDYLMIVDTNLGGGKTDGVIEQDVDLQVSIDEKGEIINTVTVRRQHFGERGQEFAGVNNVDYLRLYVPRGAELIEADGFSIPDASLFETPEEDWETASELRFSEQTARVHAASRTDIWEESGRTVFGNWIQTKPGTESVATFTYRLPFRLESLTREQTLADKLKAFAGVPATDRYALTIQKQAGILDRETRVRVSVPDGLEAIWSSHDLANATFDNGTDAFLGALFERRDP